MYVYLCGVYVCMYGCMGANGCTVYMYSIANKMTVGDKQREMIKHERKNPDIVDNLLVKGQSSIGQAAAGPCTDNPL